MKELFNSIYDKFLADGKYGLTNLYDTEADSEAVYPYVTFSLVGATSELADFTEDWENCLIQFSLFDDDPKSSDISEAYKLLKPAFHKFDLVVVDYATIALVKEVANLIYFEGVWCYNISFRIILQEN